MDTLAGNGPNGDSQQGAWCGIAGPRLPFIRYRLRFEADQEYHVRGYRGSAWRGALGHALRRLACRRPESSCSECEYSPSCAYVYLFETPPGPGAARMRRASAAPHPFVLWLDWPSSGSIVRGETVGFTLFGSAYRYADSLIQALREAGREGLRPEGQSLKLARVEREDSPGSDEWSVAGLPGDVLWREPPAARWPEPPARARVEIQTPLRLRHGAAFVRPERFRFEHLFVALLRRVSLLVCFHGGDLPEADAASLKADANAVALHSISLRWLDWTRRSSRQGARMQMGGLVGYFEYESGAFPALWPYLWLGQWIQAGKGTSMGLGRYLVRPI